MAHDRAMEACEKLDRAFATLAHSYRPAARMRSRFRQSLKRGCPVSELADWRAQYARLRLQAERKRRGRWLDRKTPPTTDAIGFDEFWDSPDNVARLEQTDRRVSELDVAIQTLSPDWIEAWFRFRNNWREFFNAAMADSGAGARAAIDRYDTELRAWRAKATGAGAQLRDPEYEPKEKDEPILSLKSVGAAAILGAVVIAIYLLKKD